MGYRTYLHAVNDSDVKSINNKFNIMSYYNRDNLDNIPTIDTYCMGKLSTYVGIDEIPLMTCVKWLDQNLICEDDIEFMEYYKEIDHINVGCEPYIIFFQLFTRDEILEFSRCFGNDKNKLYGSFDFEDAEKWINQYNYFIIEWIGG